MTTKTMPPGTRISTRAVPLQFTTAEVFVWLCDKQRVNPDYISDARYRSLGMIAEQATAKLNALYAHALTTQIESVYAGEIA